MSGEPLDTRFRGGFPTGYTAITRDGDGDLDTGIDFGILRLEAGESVHERDAKESVWVLVQGQAEIACAGVEAAVRRRSLFDEGPTLLHLGPATDVEIRARDEGAEWAVARTGNARRLAPRLFLPGDVVPEYRGAGLVQDACRREVRLVFDRGARPDSNLVVGEVINYPGRWSSYPPHHHPQPEIYHYRCTLPQGYGHAELGERVFKVRSYDTLAIPPGLDHAQVAAPGYGMYYLWIIRHLPQTPYTGFEMTAEHTWMLDPASQGWMPAERGEMKR